MSTRYSVAHTTTYTYQTPVSSSYGQAWLLPRTCEYQTVHSSGLHVEPNPDDLSERQDGFGNRVTYFEVRQPHQALTITAASEVEVHRSDGQFGFGSEESLAEVAKAAAALQGAEQMDAVHFLAESDRVPLDSTVTEYSKATMLPDRSIIECLVDLNARIHRDFSFDAKATTVTSTIADLFEKGGGVCQDFAHLAVGCLRSAGIPARYMSGYLETFPPAGQPKLVGSDVSHAWASALVPGVGWIDLDPTNNQFANERYVTVAWGRDYSDITPVKGVIYSDGGMTEMTVSVDVRRVEPPPDSPGRIQGQGMQDMSRGLQGQSQSQQSQQQQ